MDFLPQGFIVWPSINHDARRAGSEGSAPALITVLAFGAGSLALAMILGLILRIWMSLVVAVRMAEERKRLGKS